LPLESLIFVLLLCAQREEVKEFLTRENKWHKRNRETEREREQGNRGMGTGEWERGTERKFNKGNYNRT
jgi:hypothetical protein